MTTRIRLRRDTAANWAAANPVLELGEPGVETDTRKTKYGDGVTPWNGLSYASGGADANYSNATPQALGIAAAGTASSAARSDHVHAMPTAAQVGADPSGAAASAIAAHLAAADPHPTYTTAAEAAAAAPVQTVGLSVPSGWTGSSSTINGNVTLTLALPAGSSLVASSDRTNWNAAYSERLRWDGGSTGLNAAMARTSLGLATVASSGLYSDLSGNPILGTAAATDASAYATAAQGAKADTAVQPAALSNYVETSDTRLSTDLSYTQSSRLLASSTGADVTLPLVDASGAGLAPASGGGTTNFLRADGNWAAPIGSVTSVGLSAPTGFNVSGSPVTGAGTLGLVFASGYSLPTIGSQGNWDTAYSERRQWDGSSANLDASTARLSLGLGTAATKNVGTSAGNVVQLDASGNLPAVSAVNLTGLPASGVTSVSATAPIASSGGTTPTISISPATISAAGSMSAADKLKLDGLKSVNPIAMSLIF